METMKAIEYHAPGDIRVGPVPMPQCGGMIGWRGGVACTRRVRERGRLDPEPIVFHLRKKEA